MTAPDLSERARRVQIICNTLYGSVLDQDDDVMHVEIPADLAGAAASLFGAGGFSAVIIGQTPEWSRAASRTSTSAPSSITTRKI